MEAVLSLAPVLRDLGQLICTVFGQLICTVGQLPGPGDLGAG